MMVRIFFLLPLRVDCFDEQTRKNLTHGISIEFVTGVVVRGRARGRQSPIGMLGCVALLVKPDSLSRSLHLLWHIARPTVLYIMHSTYHNCFSMCTFELSLNLWYFFSGQNTPTLEGRGWKLRTVSLSKPSSWATWTNSSSSSLLSSPIKAHSCKCLWPRIMVSDAPGHLGNPSSESCKKKIWKNYNHIKIK